jgi:hypothetical protein
MHPDQLVRLHVISARFKDLKEGSECWCVVNVGAQKCQTLRLKVNSSGEVKWDENFSIEYLDKKEKDALFLIELFANGEFKGAFRQRICEINAAQESWDRSQNRDCTLTDQQGNEIGIVTFRVRREEKCYGMLKIDIKECELNQLAGQIKTAKCVVNCSTFFHETSVAEGKLDQGNVTHFNFVNNNLVQLEINKNNNIFDVFIEIWEQNPIQSNAPPSQEIKSGEKKQISGRLIGQARLPVYDARQRFNAQLPLISLETAERKMLGTVTVEAMLEKEKEEKKKTKESKKEEKKKEKERKKEEKKKKKEEKSK